MVTSLRVAMPRSYCFLCASDEGVFLEVTPESIRAAFGDQIEACLSKKVNQTIELSNKICYKCAYELDQCSKFLQKSKKSEDTSKLPKTKTSVPCCSLCCEAVENGHIFDITEDNRSVFSPLQKIRKIFSDDLCKKVNHSKLMCLGCRYNLDVLYDLKKLHEETVGNLEALIKKELDYSSFPKVYTDVVNRKTTITTFPDTTIYGLISSDSESNDEMARKKSRSKLSGKSRSKLLLKKRNIIKSQSNVKLNKSRSCDQCSNIVANGTDMYRFYNTGQTVCRNCWITTDPNKDKTKRNSYNSLAGTKLCTVYLKDVLNEGSHNEEGKNGDKLDQNSQDESLSQKMSLQKDNKSTKNGTAKQDKKRQIHFTKSDVETIPLKQTKSSVIVRKTQPAKALSDLDQPSTSFQIQKQHKRKAMSDWSSDSDHSQDMSAAKSKMRRSERLANHLTQILSSASEEDDVTKKDNKRLKSITTEVTKNVRSESNDESSNDTSGNSLKKKIKLSVSVVSVRNRTKSSSISSKETTPPTEFKSPKIVSLQDYACDKCGKKFNTKLVQAEHKLMHVKQFTLRLERVSVPSKEKEEESKVDSQKDETASEEVETDISGTAHVDGNSADLSEEIGINLDDDTDDEMLSVKHKEDCKDDDQKEKPDLKENESHQNTESSEVQVDEKAISNKSQQCADSTVSDEIAIEVDDTNDDTMLVEEVDASKDQDDNAQENNVIDENRKVSDDEKEKEDVTMEDDTEKTSAAEREECDKNFDNEITLDNEKIESQVSSTIKNNEDNIIEHSEDSDETIKNNLENNHEDDKHGKTKDAKEKSSIDLTNDFQEEDSKKSEEKILTPDVEIETLNITESNDEEDSVIEHSKKQQNTIDKQSAEIEEVTDVDKHDDNNSIKLNLLTCEILKKLDKENTEQEEDNVVADDVTDSNDTAAAKSKQITEEIITTNDLLTEEATPAETVSDLEQLMESNTECELQEENKERETCKNSHNISTDTATQIMEEVFDLAAAEVLKRRNSNSIKANSEEDFEMETLENISREIHNSADMPSLDVDSAMAINDVDNVTTSH